MNGGFMATKKKEKLDLEDPKAPKEEEINPVTESDPESEEVDPLDAELDSLEHENQRDQAKAEYEAQQKVVAKTQEKADDLLAKRDAAEKEYRKAIADRDAETRKMNSMDGAKVSNQHNIQAYLETQNKLREERYREKAKMKEMLGMKPGVAQAPIDAAMARRPGRGNARPKRTPINQG